MPDAVIDLGELTDGTSAPPSDVPPRSRRPPGRAMRVAVAVLAVGALTGSVPPDPPTHEVGIPAARGDLVLPGNNEYIVVSDTADPPGSPVKNKIVNVYALPSATRVSRTSVTVTGPILGVVTADGLVIVSYQSDGVGTVATAAFTAGTEHTVWRRYGRLIGITRSGHRALLAEIPADTGRMRWSGVEVRSGQVRWRSDRRPDGTPTPTDTAPIADTAVFAGTALVAGADRRLEQLVDVSPAGRIQARDVDTGQITTAVTVPAPAVWRTAGLRVGVAGGLLLVGAVGRDTTAYDLTDLSERWRSRQDLVGWRVQPDCGDVICLVGYSGGLRILDPATGRQRWAADTWTDVQRVGPYLLVSPSPANLSTVPPLTVLEAATGRARGTVTGWRRLADFVRADSARVDYVRTTPARADSARTAPARADSARTNSARTAPARAEEFVSVVRADASRSRVYLGVLDAGTLAVRVLGVAEQVAGDCGATAGVLVCRRTDSSYGVWPFAAP